MLAYNYDRNKEFIGCETVQQDPLEREKWLIPANSTLIAPPQYNPKQQRCIFDGVKWNVIDNPKEEVATQIQKPEDIVRQQRQKRDRLLYLTDKFMLADYPITSTERQDYVNYRQYLRNIPQSSEFPNLIIQTYEEWRGA